jgi:hypothetical protein
MRDVIRQVPYGARTRRCSESPIEPTLAELFVMPAFGNLQFLNMVPIIDL